RYRRSSGFHLRAVWHRCLTPNPVRHPSSRIRQLDPIFAIEPYQRPDARLLTAKARSGREATLDCDRVPLVERIYPRAISAQNLRISLRGSFSTRTSLSKIMVARVFVS